MLFVISCHIRAVARHVYVWKTYRSPVFVLTYKFNVNFPPSHDDTPRLYSCFL